MDGFWRILATLVVATTGCGQTEPLIETADDLLFALEKADADLTAISADIIYVKTFILAGDEHTRSGKLAFAATTDADAPRRRFAIDFTKLQMGDVIDDGFLERYVFDGEWLLEMDLEHKQFTRRQIVPPGDSFDPLRIGEGPFPIPIGQKRDEILRRFDATLAPADEGLSNDNLKKISADWMQMRLVPKEAWEDEIEFIEVRLWYQTRDDGRILPRMAKTTNTAGDESTVLLLDIKVNDNADIDEDKLSTTPPREGWDGQIIEWRG